MLSIEVLDSNKNFIVEYETSDVPRIGDILYIYKNDVLTLKLIVMQIIRGIINYENEQYDCPQEVVIHVITKPLNE